MGAAGASLREPVDWHSINWNQAHWNVRRLQARIVKALKAGQKRKVRALQSILVRSLSARALAVHWLTQARASSCCYSLFYEFLFLHLLQLSCDERPGGSLPAFAWDNVGLASIPVRSTTERPSLSPSSSTRCSFGTPCGFLPTLVGELRAYRVHPE